MTLSSKTLCALASVALLALATSGCATNVQVLDPDFDPPMREALYPEAAGPVIAVDEAHHNFHTASGRYGAFARLARKDGYRVVESKAAASREALADVDLLVIANALSQDDVEKWRLPNPSAFTVKEIEELVSWVEEGGALLLIADHMPFPGAAGELWQAFGIYTVNGYAARRDGEPIVFEAGDNLKQHAITEGIDVVQSFTGQGFRAVAEVEPLMVLPEGTVIRMTTTAGKFKGVAEVTGDYLLQGAVAERGQGRVAFFGEAAMFSAQKIRRDGTEITFGMNAPGAESNVLFLRRVLAWLSGAESLPES